MGSGLIGLPFPGIGSPGFSGKWTPHLAPQDLGSKLLWEGGWETEPQLDGAWRWCQRVYNLMRVVGRQRFGGFLLRIFKHTSVTLVRKDLLLNNFVIPRKTLPYIRGWVGGGRGVKNRHSRPLNCHHKYQLEKRNP